ncbi:hypothetical protein MAR_018249 [Mya arenaria]|uniref:Uncharacterized protein n=1 Tax=Mya arenaria TaxID=6604 RepID=A0ABY7EM74_MYAAR|nr:hypothetical protein MAR_018249 [Mya arenaria]
MSSVTNLSKVELDGSEIDDAFKADLVQLKENSVQRKLALCNFDGAGLALTVRNAIQWRPVYGERLLLKASILRCIKIMRESDYLNRVPLKMNGIGSDYQPVHIRTVAFVIILRHENEDIETTDAAKTINTPQTGLMKDRETKRTPVGAIVGPIVALLVGVVLVGLFLLFKRRKNRETDNGMNGMTNELYWGQSARPHQDTQPGIGIAELNRREDGTDEKRSFDNAEYFRTQEIMDNINVGNTDLKACDGDMEHRTVGNQYGTADNTNTSGFGSSDGKYFNNVYDNAKAHQC